jgi:hypothetical protein
LDAIVGSPHVVWDRRLRQHIEKDPLHHPARVQNHRM